LKAKKIFIAFGIASCFTLGFWISQNFTEQLDFASSRVDSWTFSGYLPESPRQKVYITVVGDKIGSISKQKPRNSGVLLETEAWIFPGLMNMHNHHKYNIFSLWPEAKGQFTNRFEWRDRYPPYKDYASFNLRALPASHTCAAIRWAELKELVAGITTTQGVSGSELECAADSGPRNVEILGEMKEQTKALSLIDTIAPELMGSVYLRWIKPLVADKKIPYQQAVQKILEQQGVYKWFQQYQTLPQNLASGLILTVGKDFGLSPEAKSPQDFKKIQPQLKAHLLSRKWATEADVERKIQQVQSWIFGSSRQEGYLVVEIPMTSALEDKTALQLFDSWGIFVLPESLRSYANFEAYVRPRILKQGPVSNAVIIHLSEGSRSDAYSQAEYSLLHEVGLNQKNAVIVHGVAMTSEQLDQMAKLGQSLIWSPFSNLLLYGDTLNLAEVRKRKINLALGTDWSISGSKNLFDELRLAKNYLKATGEASLTDKEWVEAVTFNAAKSLSLQDRFGVVARGFQADLLLVQRKSADPYSDFVSSDERNVELVSVRGQPLYGNRKLIEAFSRDWNDPEAPEALQACGEEKALRILGARPVEPALDLRSIHQTEKILKDLLSSYRQQVEKSEPSKVKALASLDSLFSCEDPVYQNKIKTFIAEAWPNQKKDRRKLRSQTGLVEYNPLSPGSSEGAGK